MKPDSSRKVLRCAIYTRVSTDAGLEQDFNSLDAQREASEAYIKSQAHEGWKLIRDRFDDGGFSGGSMERPALQKLLDDVSSRKIDIIVVYKVDRLTRSLADFAKLVELFDAHGVSFVSVTQSFNTTTSMGRLTLNVLLSFAQFEREVTGERIRDKIAASKKKGIWMGGVVPLGYRVEARALHVVEEQARFVRTIFERYLAAGSVVRLKQALDAEDVRVPNRIDGAGRRTGGGYFSRGHLHTILTNPIYVGQLAHKGNVHDGQHQPIVERALWEAVQRRLAEQAQTTRTARQGSDAPLAGKLFDDRGNRMTPTWAAKGGRRWRYYVSQAILQGRRQDAGSFARVPADAIESAVLEAAARATAGDRSLTGEPPDAGHNNSSLVLADIQRVTIRSQSIELQMTDAAIERGADSVMSVPWNRPSKHRRREILAAASADGNPRPIRDDARKRIVAALGKAHSWLDELTHNSQASVEAIARREGETDRSIRRTLSLAFLAPDLVAAAVEGRLARGFNLTRLLDLPPDWAEQRRTLGLAA